MQARGGIPDKCQATTKKNRQCSFNPRPGEVFCGIHLKQRHAPQAPVALVAPVAPEAQTKPKANDPAKAPPLGDLTLPNSPRIIKQIAAKLKAKPAKADAAKGGYIYIYRLANETHLNYWKVGMTRKDVDSRMSQWEAKHKGRVICVARYHLTRNVAYAERLCHLYLDYCRMNRYPCEITAQGAQGETRTVFKSTWYRSGRLVDDEQSRLVEGRVVARNKHHEWFACEWEHLEHVVSELVDYCRQI